MSFSFKLIAGRRRLLEAVIRVQSGNWVPFSIELTPRLSGSGLHSSNRAAEVSGQESRKAKIRVRIVEDLPNGNIEACKRRPGQERKHEICGLTVIAPKRGCFGESDRKY